MTIKKCSCKDSPAAKFQDTQYGKGNRLHTEGYKEFTCTVCGKKTPNRG